jgi:hypothetical protein
MWASGRREKETKIITNFVATTVIEPLQDLANVPVAEASKHAILGYWWCIHVLHRLLGKATWSGKDFFCAAAGLIPLFRIGKQFVLKSKPIVGVGMPFIVFAELFQKRAHFAMAVGVGR